MGHVIVAGHTDPVGAAIVGDLARREGLTVEGFPTAASALEGFGSPDPSVLIITPAVPAADAIALAAALQRKEVDTATLLVVNDLDTQVLRAALKVGVRDVLTLSDGIDSISAAVVAADEAVARRRATSPVAGAAAPAPKLGTVVTVFSTKGGVGKSVLATNIAVALASEFGKRTILLDLDLESGDVSVMLQLPPERTIYDAAQVFDRLDPEMLSGFLIQHGSGLSVLLAPVRPEDAETVTTVRVARIITMLKTLADFVVIDTPASLSEVVLTALEQSDLVLAVATLDVPSVKNTKVSLQKLHQLGLDGSSVRLVLNRADSKVWLEPHEIEKTLADRIVARIPSDRVVPRSVNKGVPVVVDAPRSAVARSILALAREVATSPDGE